MSIREEVTRQTACPDCLRRGKLLAELAPYIERHDHGKLPEGLLALSNPELAVTVAGDAAECILTKVSTYPVEQLVAEIVAAGCWSICKHTDHQAGRMPGGLFYVEGLGAIYGMGDVERLSDVTGYNRCVSVVGARRATTYGREVARSLGRELADASLVVVSGMAFGVDACAHRGALEHGPTVAVLGCGPDVAYPASHRSLWRRIRENGLVLSEMPPGTGAWRWAFTARSRLIAAMSGMTVVVEAAEVSGSLATARFAEGMERKVGATPGAVGSRNSDGPNRLIADGAALIRNGTDVLGALGIDQDDQAAEERER